VLYLAVTGALWTVVGLVLVVGLWLRRKWSAWGAPVAVALYPAYYWIDRLLVADRSAIANRVVFLVVATLLVCGYLLFASFHPKTRAYLTK
jgi:hypothetical protein